MIVLFISLIIYYTNYMINIINLGISILLSTLFINIQIPNTMIIFVITKKKLHFDRVYVLATRILITIFFLFIFQQSLIHAGLAKQTKYYLTPWDFIFFF